MMIWDAISVACGNSSAPGSRGDSLHAKICKKFDARSMQVCFFAKYCLKNLISPKTSQNETPRVQNNQHLVLHGTKRDPIWAKRTPKWTQRVPKGRQKCVRNPPTPAGVRRFRLKKPDSEAPPSEACPPYPPGAHLWYLCCSFRGHFWHQFLVSISACLFFNIFAILDGFWLPFWLPFGIIFHTFCMPFSCIDFALILYGSFMTF